MKTLSNFASSLHVYHYNNRGEKLPPVQSLNPRIIPGLCPSSTLKSIAPQGEMICCHNIWSTKNWKRKTCFIKKNILTNPKKQPANRKSNQSKKHFIKQNKIQPTMTSFCSLVGQLGPHVKLAHLWPTSTTDQALEYCIEGHHINHRCIVK